MRYSWRFLIMTIVLHCPLLAQQSPVPESADTSPETILLKQAQNRQGPRMSAQDMNERIGRMVKPFKTQSEYLLGAGDVIELTVAGIPGMDKKSFPLDFQGSVSIPYLGEVGLDGITAREAEAKLTRLYAVSVLEDPQVTVSIREYRSRHYYVMGAVRQPGKYPLTQATDILDALATAGGIGDRADSKFKIYRHCQGQPSADSAPPAIEFSLTSLLEKGQNEDLLSIFPGDVIEVPERREKAFYVLGDIVKPGAFLIDSNSRMHLSLALANAGGMLKTASGKKVYIVRQKQNRELPEQIQVNAYAVLKGDSKDVELCENDIVLVPGSASKTLGKNLANGVVGFLGTLLLVGTR